MTPEPKAQLPGEVERVLLWMEVGELRLWGEKQANSQRLRAYISAQAERIAKLERDVLHYKEARASAMFAGERMKERIAALEADNNTLKHKLCEIDCGKGEDYLTNRVSLSKLSGVPAMAIVYSEHIKIVTDKISALEAETKRLRSALEKIRKSGYVSYSGPKPHVIAADALAHEAKPGKVCKTCGGDGVIYTGDWFSPKEYCPNCNGSGRV